jgi:hypothetical protein
LQHSFAKFVVLLWCRCFHSTSPACINALCLLTAACCVRLV